MRRGHKSQRKKREELGISVADARETNHSRNGNGSPRNSTRSNSKRLRKSKTISMLAQEMLDELEYYYFEVGLTPAPIQPQKSYTTLMIRAVMVANAPWYKDFCGDYTANRRRPRHRKKHDTLIKRQATARGLRELIDGRCKSEYAKRLHAFILRRLREGRKTLEPMLPITERAGRGAESYPF